MQTTFEKSKAPLGDFLPPAPDRKAATAEPATEQVDKNIGLHFGDDISYPPPEVVAAASARVDETHRRLGYLAETITVQFYPTVAFDDDEDSRGHLYHVHMVEWESNFGCITLDDREALPIGPQIVAELRRVAREYELLAARVANQLADTEELGPPTDVWLLDPKGESDPELAYSAETRLAAECWKTEWAREPWGLVAVLTAAGERPELKGGAV